MGSDILVRCSRIDEDYSSFEVERHSKKGCTHNINEIMSLRDQKQSCCRRQSSTHHRSVIFAPCSRIYQVEHQEDLPEEDLWYSRLEFDSMNVISSNIVRKINQGRFKEKDVQTARGLERKAEKTFARYCKNRNCGLNAVLKEQNFQRRKGIWDPIAVALAYHNSIAKKCQEDAAVVGRADAEISRRIVEEDTAREMAIHLSCESKSNAKNRKMQDGLRRLFKKSKK